ncbi:MAG: hypothetical protein M1832_003474 [Thelocarpon impressellum]|nr:MAG: hypothetical protein M1832_003474 [Thelocarpon impressellum]
MSNFDPNAIIRGAQLTVVGTYRALQNPGLFKYEHYRQAALAVAAGLVIRLAIEAPIVAVRIFLWILSFFIDAERTTWDDKIISGLEFTERSVLQLPLFLMSLMRYVVPTLDQMSVPRLPDRPETDGGRFMDSLQWVDQTYVQMHKSEDPHQLRSMYYPNLRLYSTHGDAAAHRPAVDAGLAFLKRFGRRAAISLAIYALSFVPVVGRLVLPAASFYTLNKAAGPIPAAVIFSTGLFLPRRYLVVFLQSYFSSRGLVQELLVPYFSRVRFTREQKARWFRDREGLLFGFGLGFYLLLKLPVFGVLAYGVAEASTAYLITKITDPPPPPARSDGFAESQVRWRNKSAFLKLPLARLDAHNVLGDSEEESPLRTAEEVHEKAT